MTTHPSFLFKTVVLLLFATGCSLPGYSQASGAKPAGTKSDSVTMADLRYLRNVSLVIRNLEDSLKIDSANFESRVRFISVAISLIPDTIAGTIGVPYSAEFPKVVFEYTRLLTYGVNSGKTDSLIKSARLRRLTKPGFADGLANIESKAIFNQVLAGLELSLVANLSLPASVINAVIDHLHGKINAATALFSTYDYVKKKAVATNRLLLYKYFQEYYDAL